jgi:GT2 family glycosyltransferase
MTFAVVICTYSHDRWDDLVRAVESVRRQRRPADRIVVAVDGDETLADRIRAELPGVTTTTNTGQRGLSGARNAGIRASADADVIAFLDDDAVAEPDWLEALARPSEDPATAGVGGAIDAAWDTGRPRWFPAEFDWVVGCSYNGLPETAGPVRNFIGANMSFRRTVLEEAGGFLDGIGRVGTRPVGCEETELCLRVIARRPDAVLLHEPRARVAHRVPSDRARWSYFWRRCWAEGLSKALVADAHGSGRALASERRYASRVLPAAFGRSLAAGRIVRASAIGGGLLTTAAGYVAGVAGGTRAQ